MRKSHEIFNLILEVSDKCNLNCKCCYHDNSGANMPMDIAIEAINKVAAYCD